jgi:uncharacterized membrane protein HdeD (DUF308 family)
MSSTSSAAPGTASDSTAAGAFMPRRTTAATATGAWWLYLVTGIIWTLYGMFVLSLRPGSVASLAWFAGFAFIFAGVSYFFTAQRVDSWRWLFYVGGVLGILAGFGAFAWPGKTLYVIAVFVAWYLVFGGILSIIAAFMGPKRDWWWMGIVVGILQFVLGVWAIGSPGRELLLLVNLVGIYMIFFGVSEIFAAFAVRSARQATVP